MARQDFEYINIEKKVTVRLSKFLAIHPEYHSRPALIKHAIIKFLEREE